MVPREISAEQTSWINVDKRCMLQPIFFGRQTGSMYDDGKCHAQVILVFIEWKACVGRMFSCSQAHSDVNFLSADISSGILP